MLSPRVRFTMLILVSGTLPALHALAEPPSTDSTVDDSVLRAALGQCAGEPGFDRRADLNEDGCVNVLDVAILRKRAAELKASDDLEPSDVRASRRRRASGCEVIEEIFVHQGAVTAQAGSCGMARFRIRPNSTPLLGYSLDIDISPDAGATGSVTADVALTNFYIGENLIEDDPFATLHPLFSLILDPGDGGVFVNAITADFTVPVTAVPGTNDVLAEVIFNASGNADGDFTIQLGPATALADANADAVAYDFTPRTLTATSCLADFDADGVVRVPDLIILLGAWGFCGACCPADFDGSGDVRVPDLITLLGEWGTCL